MTMASRVGVMSEGRLLQVGAPAQIYETPATRFVADFIGNVNLMDGTLAIDEPDHCVVGCADCATTSATASPGPPGMRVTVALRPEKMHLSRNAPSWRDYNAVQGTVKEMSYFGSYTVYHLQLPSGAMLKVSQPTRSAIGDDDASPGARRRGRTGRARRRSC